ncbi:MAG: DUF4233 domain-containing protein [Actinomycetota bacterium]|nr:DUF4233 domain-containing protein [Actinomycetota bacterium]MDP2289425.1 DUF4233 domain-containing protein [Actinomycetota bacterium]
MKILCSAVLSLEAIAVFLAIPVVATNGTVQNTALVVALGLLLTVLLFLAVGTLRRSWGLTLGWLLQIPVLAIGFLAPAMFIVGGVFLILWYVAIQQGSRVDAIKAQHGGAEPPLG